MTKWLSTEQQAYWRAWLAASMLLRDQLTKEIQEQHGLTMADYEILVQLSEHPERRMRMNELAACTLVSRSRLTHQIDRMAKAGSSGPAAGLTEMAASSRTQRITRVLGKKRNRERIILIGP